MESNDHLRTIDQEGHRGHIKAYHLWFSLLKGRSLPSINDLSPDELEQFKPNFFLVDFPNGYDTPVVRFSGSQVEADGNNYSLDPGAIMRDAPNTSVFSQVKNLIEEVTKIRTPIGFDAQSDDVSGSLRLSRGILLPFGDDGGNVQFVMGVVTWLEEAEEGKLVADQPSEIDEKIIKKEGGESNLYEVLEETREAANKVFHVDSRSRDALYDVLAQAYSFRIKAEDDFSTYENILQSAGLREQERAPFTPVIKLIFGKNYDKTRITEYASALCFAARNDIRPEDVKFFIMSIPGCIKGCVQKERVARRKERGDSPSGALEQAKEILNNIDPIASVKNIPGKDEFVVLIGRRKKGAKKVNIVGLLVEETQYINSILKRAARAEKVFK